MWTERTHIIMRFDRSRIDAYSILDFVDRPLESAIASLVINQIHPLKIKTSFP